MSSPQSAWVESSSFLIDGCARLTKPVGDERLYQITGTNAFRGFHMKKLFAVLVAVALVSACSQPTSPSTTKVAPPHVAGSRYILISGGTPPRGCVESETVIGYWECN